MNILIHTEGFSFYSQFCLALCDDLKKKGHKIFRTFCKEPRHRCYAQQCLQRFRCTLEDCEKFVTHWGWNPVERFPSYDQLVRLSINDKACASEYERGSMEFAVLGMNERMKMSGQIYDPDPSTSTHQGCSLMGEIERAINDNHIDVMITFNGSFWESWAGMLAAKRCNVPIWAFECFGSGRIGWLAKNGSIHDPQAVKNLCECLPDIKDEDIDALLSERIKDVNSCGGKHEKIEVCVCGSYQPEHKYNPSLYSIARDKSEIEDAERLQALLGDAYRVTYCCHPFPEGYYKKYLDSLTSNTVAIVHLNSGGTSHSVIRQSDVVVSFSCSVPAEAAWIGKPILQWYKTPFSLLIAGLKTVYSAEECAKEILSGVSVLPKESLRDYVKYYKGIREFQLVL